MEKTNKDKSWVNAFIYFEGNKKDLNRLHKDMVVDKPVTNYTKLNYSSLKSIIPGISKEEIYKLVGFDYELARFDEKVRKVLDTLGYIDFREAFINKEAIGVSVEFKGEDLLVKMRGFRYVPMGYFQTMAAKHGVKMRAVEKTDAIGLNIVSLEDFHDEESPYFNQDDPPSTRIVRTPNGTQSILNDPEFRKNAVELGVHKPAYHVVVALAYGKTDLAKSIVEEYGVTANNMRTPIAVMESLLENPEDFFAGSCNESPFVDFIEKRPKNISKMDFMAEFKKLAELDVDLDVVPVAAKSKKPKMK